MVEQQLSLAVGGEIGTGIISTFKIAGEATVKGELKRDARVHIIVTDDDGEIVYAKYGSVTSVAIKSKKNAAMRWTERQHTITIDELDPEPA